MQCLMSMNLPFETGPDSSMEERTSSAEKDKLKMQLFFEDVMVKIQAKRANLSDLLLTSQIQSKRL